MRIGTCGCLHNPSDPLEDGQTRIAGLRQEAPKFLLGGEVCVLVSPFNGRHLNIRVPRGDYAASSADIIIKELEMIEHLAEPSAG